MIMSKASAGIPVRSISAGGWGKKLPGSFCQCFRSGSSAANRHSKHRATMMALHPALAQAMVRQHTENHTDVDADVCQALLLKGMYLAVAVVLHCMEVSLTAEPWGCSAHSPRSVATATSWASCWGLIPGSISSGVFLMTCRTPNSRHSHVPVSAVPTDPAAQMPCLQLLHNSCLSCRRCRVVD